jgi:mRNA interferase MazF
MSAYDGQWPERVKLRPFSTIAGTDSFYVPLATQNRGSRYEVALGRVSFLSEESSVNVQGIGSLPRVRLERRPGQVPEGSLAEIKQALRFALGL